MSSTPVELQFIPVAVVDECAHEVWDVEAKVADQFSGIDLVNRQTRVHTVKAQIRQECGMYDLSVEGSSIPVEGRGALVGVFTQKRVEEGAEICTASCLWFSSEATLGEFLSRPGHAQWADRLVKVPGLLQNGEATTLYGVLVGVSGEINHASAGGVGTVNARLPNAQLHLQPTVGLNTGLLVVKAVTSNKLGIAKGKEVLLDYGVDYLFSQVPRPVGEATTDPAHGPAPAGSEPAPGATGPAPGATGPTPRAPGPAPGGTGPTPGAPGPIPGAPGPANNPSAPGSGSAPAGSEPPPADKTQVPDAVKGPAWVQGTSVTLGGGAPSRTATSCW